MTDATEGRIDRRKFLTGAAVVGAGIVGGVAGTGIANASASDAWRRETLEIDVACVGERWRQSDLNNPADDADFHVGFSVEGWIYPAGTVPTQGFVPTPEGAIGEWFCRGWQIVDGGRLEPHVSTTQLYVFGRVTAESLFPRDNLTSIGLEGTEDETQVAYRPVSGGTGQYIGATGEVAQLVNGVNTSVFADGSGLNAPNWIFQFDLLVPNV